MDSELPSQILGRRLTQLQRKTGSVRAFARSLGVPSSTLQRWMEGGSFDALDRVHMALQRAGLNVALVASAADTPVSSEDSELLASFHAARPGVQALVRQLLS